MPSKRELNVAFVAASIDDHSPRIVARRQRPSYQRWGRQGGSTSPQGALTNSYYFDRALAAAIASARARLKSST